MKTDISNLRPAAEYERYAQTFLKPWDDLLIARLCELLAGRAHGVLLDVGTGTAVLPRKLARVPQFEGWRFIAIDSFEAEVGEARQQIAAEQLEDRIDTRLGDAHRLAAEYANVDCVISRATLHHLKDPVLALRELYRILAPGGVCVIHDMRRDADQHALAEFTRMRRESGYPATHIEEKFTLPEARALVDAAGLGAVAAVYSGESGSASLGFEIVMRRAA
jgi:ubiquinone/menaquinone biosynthesis C-methylase UbiE